MSITIEVLVCDAPMGAGKTQSAITMMNESVGEKFLFVTPYNDETQRIRESCSGRDFASPAEIWGSKLNGLHELLERGSNIASTHSLFSMYTQKTARLIRDGGYTLVLDEVHHVINIIEMQKGDIRLLMNSGCVKMADDGKHVLWTDKSYKGGFDGIRQMAEANTLILYNNALLLWEFPMEIFRAFKRIVILTYLYDGSIQRHYFDMHGIESRKIGTRLADGVYRFCDDATSCRKITNVKRNLSILDDEKLNGVGDDKNALSTSWFERAAKKGEKPQLERLKKNYYNFFRNRCQARASEVMWTTRKKYREYLETPKGFSSGFVSCNIRATNKYRDRKYVAYCVNVFYNPLLKQYLAAHGCVVDEDANALSEMIQWIWRSAIRDGNPIKAYIPSRRMRTLLIRWIDEVDGDADGGEDGVAMPSETPHPTNALAPACCPPRKTHRRRSEGGKTAAARSGDARLAASPDTGGGDRRRP